MSASPFVHLHNHTMYSLLDGVSKIPDLVQRAQKYKMSALAMTDHGNLFGAVSFYKAACKGGIQPIIGMEAYVAPKSRFDRSEHRRTRSSHLVLLVQNETGYRNLMALSSLSYLEGFYYKPRIDRELLKSHSDGLVALGGCLAGDVNMLLRTGNEAEAESRALEYRDIFDGRFYFELMDHGMTQQKELIPMIVDLGRKLNIPLVATNDCHYLDRDHAEAHDVLLCIQTGKTLDDPRRTLRYQTNEMYFKSPKEMNELFGEFPDALRNTVRIAESCSFEMELGNLKLPHFPCPEGYKDLDGYLAHLCREGAVVRYGACEGKILERMEYELGVIRKMGYAGYFLIVHDFIAYARREGIPVGPGRGSAAGSLVAYVLRITNIDPLEYGLIFERFLNPARITMPDIDIDFADKDRPRIIRYVVERYGEANVSQIITFGTMAARAVIRDVGRVLGFPYGDVDKLAKMVPAEPKMTLEKAFKQNPDLPQATQADPRLRRLMRIARVLEGTNRHASTHAAGIVISSTPLIETVPLYKTSDAEVTTQFDMKASEMIGLLKIDLLGLRTLTVIKDALELIKKNRGVDLDIESISLDDPAVYKLLGRGDCVGVFQFESAGMVENLRKLQPEVLDDLIAMNGLYRPGPLRSGMVSDFIERKRGREEIRYEHPTLEPILKDTCGVIVFQEQVMRIASDLAGYSLGEADKLRRAMAKKIVKDMAEQEVIFIEKAVERNTRRKTAKKIFDLMASFAEYGFNRSHSAGYALVAYQTAYLKTHYPVEFMAASMTSEMSNSDRLKILLADCRRQGITVLPPDVHKSRAGFHVEGETIWFGLEAVKGVGHGAVEGIIKAREDVDTFQSLFDLVEHVDPGVLNKKAMESLIQAGGFDQLGANRAQLLLGLPVAMEWGARLRRDRMVGQSSLFGDGNQVGGRAPSLPDIEDWAQDEKLHRERDVLGFYLTGHPLDALRDLTRALGVQQISNLKGLSQGRKVSIAGIASGIQHRSDKKGQPIAFFQVDDGSASCECQCFADAFKKWGESLVSNRPILIKGKTRSGEEAELRITIDQLLPLDEIITGDSLSLHLVVDPSSGDEGLQSLKKTLGAFQGKVPVFLHVAQGEGHPILIKLRSSAVRPDPELLQNLHKISGVEQVRLVLDGGPGGLSSSQGKNTVSETTEKTATLT